MNALEWLDSTEGQQWSLRNFADPGPDYRTRQMGVQHASPPVSLGPLDPAYDPCGRPPLGERDL